MSPPWEIGVGTRSDATGLKSGASLGSTLPVAAAAVKGRRVAIVTSTFLPTVGGAELVAYRLARALESRGCRAYVITNFKPFLFAVYHRLPVRVLPLPPLVLRLTAAAPRMVFAILRSVFALYQRRYKFSSWYANNGIPTGLFVADFCTRRGLPSTLRCSGEDIQVADIVDYGLRRDPRLDDLVRHYYPAFDKLVATTESMKIELVDLGVSDAAIETIPNPIDLDRFATAAERDRTKIRSNRGIGDEFLFLTVGRNHRKKGFRTLLEATKMVVDQNLGLAFRVLFAGTGYQPLAAAAAEMGIRDLVQFTEITARPDTTVANFQLPADELVDLYRASDCFILASYVEGFPNVIAEAMAAGLPVITTDAPGCRDMVKGFADPVLFPPGDAGTLAKQMIRTMTDLNLQQRLSESASVAVAAFATEKVIDRYMALFFDLADTGRE